MTTTTTQNSTPIPTQPTSETAPIEVVYVGRHPLPDGTIQVVTQDTLATLLANLQANPNGRPLYPTHQWDGNALAWLKTGYIAPASHDPTTNALYLVPEWSPQAIQQIFVNKTKKFVSISWDGTYNPDTNEFAPQVIDHVAMTNEPNIPNLTPVVNSTPKPKDNNMPTITPPAGSQTPTTTQANATPTVADLQAQLAQEQAAHNELIIANAINSGKLSKDSKLYQYFAQVLSQDRPLALNLLNSLPTPKPPPTLPKNPLANATPDNPTLANTQPLSPVEINAKVAAYQAHHANCDYRTAFNAVTATIDSQTQKGDK
jgi:hypothetical protein